MVGKKLIFAGACLAALVMAVPAFAKDNCYSETALKRITQQYKLKLAKCYWNSDTAESEEEFQCVKTWVAPDKTYLSAELKSGCYSLKKHTASQMRELYKVGAPIAEPEGDEAALPSDAPLFTDYPVASIYRGKARAPESDDRSRNLAVPLSDISKSVKRGVQFAGEYAVAQAGCGTGCSNVVFASLRTGKLLSFPRGGETNQGLELEFRTDSRQMLVRWFTDSFWETCVYETFILDDGRWTPKISLPSKNKEACENSSLWLGLLEARGR
ncbi:hypothetical protein GAO09_29050 [Rhizobiales bacterium RZME27]|uniref:Uncharacterized protein n=1 Tax=Endobacterium cereale TaxID=2663029 RepID=A0A6A8AFH7_9HYPH|nr:hypothetical protein [Endobacterium cereale]MQY50083.1 hypothetical protein [Endobacterium cereale]